MNGPSPTRTRSAACAGPLPDNTSIASIGAANVRSLIVFIFTLLQEKLASIPLERTHDRAACSTSPRRGEVGSRSDPGEGGPVCRESLAPSPHPSPQRGEGAGRVRGGYVHRARAIMSYRPSWAIHGATLRSIH